MKRKITIVLKKKKEEEKKTDNDTVNIPATQPYTPPTGRAVI